MVISLTPSLQCLQYESNSVTVLTQVSHPGKAWVEADLLDFVCASQEEVNDPVGHNTVGETLDDMMKSSSHV